MVRSSWVAGECFRSRGLRVSDFAGFGTDGAAFGACFAGAAAFFGSVLDISSGLFPRARLLVRRGGGGDIGRFSEDVELDSFAAALTSAISPWPIFLRFRCPSPAATAMACFSDGSSGDGTAGEDSAGFIAGGL